MTFAQIKTEIISNIGRGSTTEILALIDNWVNRVQRTVCQDRNWWFMRRSASVAITAVVTSTDYDLPAYAAGPPEVWEYKDDAVFWLAESGVSKPAILPIIGEDDALRYYTTDDCGKPRHAVLKGSKYTLYPYSDDSYTLYLVYYGYLPDLVDTTNETNEITNRKPELLIDGGTWLGYKYLQEHMQAQQWKADFDLGLRDLRAVDVTRKIGQRHELVPRLDTRASSIRGNGNNDRWVSETY